MIDFDFVEKGGRPGHEGLIPITGRPRRAESILFELELAGASKDVQIEFVAKNGSLIGRAVLTRGEGDRYTGTCTIPDVPFRAAVVGRDADGERFRRIERGLREPL
jgi:hypothetical protein